MNCQSCGHESPGDSVFCEGCGVKLERACESCGTLNSSAARFCRKCGTSLVETRPGDTAERDPRSYTPKHLADKILRT